jgi:hypothetical protein
LKQGTNRFGGNELLFNLLILTFESSRYDKLKGTTLGAYNSAIYNERALLFSLQTILSFIKDPPILFHEFVRHHFIVAKDEILQLGQLILKSDSNDSSHKIESQGALQENNEKLLIRRFGIVSPSTISSGFILALQTFFPQLKEALSTLSK